MQKRYAVHLHPSEGTGKRHFSRRESAVAFAAKQAAAAWRVAATWTVVDRKTSGRIFVDPLGNEVATVR